MNINLTIEIWKKGKWFIARTPELDFISQGRTHDEAKKNLLEVIKIQFKEMKKMGTFKDYLDECGFKIKNHDLLSTSEMISFEKSLIKVS
jgi:predicted RNase H-like HicB family nuclease